MSRASAAASSRTAPRASRRATSVTSSPAVGHVTTARSRTRRRAPRWTISASIPRGTPRTTLWDGPDTIHRRTTGTSASSSTIRRAGARVTTTSRSSARGSTIRSTCTAPTPTSSGTARRCPSANVATRTWGYRRAQASALTSPTSGTVSTSAARSELRCTNGARSRVSCRRRRRHRHRHRHRRRRRSRTRVEAPTTVQPRRRIRARVEAPPTS